MSKIQIKGRRDIVSIPTSLANKFISMKMNKENASQFIQVETNGTIINCTLGDIGLIEIEKEKKYSEQEEQNKEEQKYKNYLKNKRNQSAEIRSISDSVKKWNGMIFKLCNEREATNDEMKEMSEQSKLFFEKNPKRIISDPYLIPNFNIKKLGISTDIIANIISQDKYAENYL